MPIVMFSLGIIFFLLVVSIDIFRYCIIDRDKRFESVYGNNTNFFSRLSNIERKNWLAAETYNREILSYSTIPDYTYERLKNALTPTKSLFSLDPPNYSILSNTVYRQRLLY